MNGRWTKLRTGVRQFGYMVVFAAAILSLAALATWWSFFIRSSVAAQHQASLDVLAVSIRALSLTMGHQGERPPPEGPLDDKAELVRCAAATAAPRETLEPFWPQFCVQARPDYLASIDRTYQRRTLMVTGESTVLLLVVSITILMLVRMIFLQRRMADELQDFQRRVTHEIKTPITGLKAFLQTIKAQELPRARMLALADLALRQVERQQMLAENLLMGQRLGHADYQLQPRSIPLAAFLRAFVEQRAPLAPLARVTLRLDGDEDQAVMADPDALRVIMENLWDNALKYGGAEPEIAISTTRQDDGRIAVRVQDRGTGFPSHLAEAVFDAYRRLHNELPSGKRGTGLGLHLSRGLARSLRGDLRAQSDGPGTGAVFTLTLPLVKGT